MGRKTLNMFRPGEGEHHTLNTKILEYSMHRFVDVVCPVFYYFPPMNILRSYKKADRQDEQAEKTGEHRTTERLGRSDFGRLDRFKPATTFWVTNYLDLV